MKYALALLLFVASCYGGTTNYFAQRPSLTAIERGTNSNFSFIKQIPNNLIADAWHPIPAPYSGTSFCFSVSCSNDFILAGPPTWINSGGGALEFDSIDRIYRKPPGLFNISKWTGWSCFFWLKINDDSVAEQDTFFGWTDGQPVVQAMYLTNSIQFWTRDAASVIVVAQCRAYDHDQRPTFVAMVHDSVNQTRNLYTNGILASSVSVGTQTNIITTTRNSLVGARNSGGTVNFYFTGTIYEFGIYTNYTLSSNDQWEIYNTMKQVYQP